VPRRDDGDPGGTPAVDDDLVIARESRIDSSSGIWIAIG
jgi:hypothetical protein